MPVHIARRSHAFIYHWLDQLCNVCSITSQTYWCSLSYRIAKLGLISSQESAESSVTDDDARKFLEYEESKELEAAFDDDMDADDLVWNLFWHSAL